MSKKGAMGLAFIMLSVVMSVSIFAFTHPSRPGSDCSGVESKCDSEKKMKGELMLWETISRRFLSSR